MDFKKFYQKIKELVVGEIKEELRDFKSSITGELAGFGLAIREYEWQNG
ncbi:MAG: hypothetical protein ACP5HI_08390 [Caldimicrobium sp.]|jgi:hypothetical protein